MVEAFKEGALAAGHTVDAINVAHLEISGCRGCEYCHTKGNGSCIQHDGMEEVYRSWDEADMIVLASPIYYGSFSSQLHSAIHRTYAGDKPKNCKKMALLLCSGASGVYENAENIYHRFIAGYYGTKDMGIFEATTSKARSTEMREAIRSFASKL